MNEIKNNTKKDNLIKNLVNVCKNNKKLALAMILGVVVLLIILTTATTSIVNYYSEKKKAEQLEEISYKVTKIGQMLNCKTLVTFASPDGIKQISCLDENNNVTEVINANGKMIAAIDYNMREGKSYSFDVIYKNGSRKRLSIAFKIPRIEGNYLETEALYVNEPYTSKFETYHTRYMIMDENDKMIPGTWIDKEPPSNWYDYSERKWANILVENEGIESYYVWIPRYCYKLDNNNQRSEILFLNTDNEFINKQTGEKKYWDELEEEGYIIPDAFSWYSTENGLTWIPGYWIAKYQISEKTSLPVDWNYVVNMSSITVKCKEIETEEDEEAVRYAYAIDGQVVATTESTTYTFNALSGGTKHINVTVLNSDGAIIGSMTKEIELAIPNAPDISKFDKDTTFYVVYDDYGNETRVSLNQDAPSGWYNYSMQKWANIVTTANNTESYWVWIPRYEYYINEDIAALQAPNQRSTVRFLSGTNGADPGYIVPDAFKFNGRELTGYWIAKYQLRDI